MTDHSKAERRDEVLFAFHRECDEPTTDDIVRWTNRYPEFAEDIRDHAAILLEMAFDADDAAEAEIDEQMMGLANSRTLNAIYNAQIASGSEDTEKRPTFDQMVAAAGISRPQLCSALDIGRDVISALFNGQMRPPIGARLIQALLPVLRITTRQFDWALDHALARPKVGYAKSSKQPTVIQSSYEDVIRNSTMMSPDRKSYWLEDA